MTSFVLKRLLSLIPVVVVVSIVIFSITYLTPGDPARTILGPDASPEQVQALRESLGLNAPLVTQYFSWLGGVLTGDLGDSFFLRKSVLSAIGDNLTPTLQLATIAITVALILAIPLGTLAARYRGTGLDRGVMAFTLLGMAVPSFVLGLLLMLLFAVKLRWVPVAGYVNPMLDFSAGMKTLILPGVALGAIVAALITRTTRAAVLDVLSSDYIDAARSRGVSNVRLLFTHTLKNAGLPILTIVGLTVGTLVTGAAVTETIFNIPGIGSLLVQAISRRDYAVIQGVVLMITFFYLFINLFIDLLYGLVDPRVRLGGKKGA
ncbi:ABC transporter permease [Leucobacter sp. UCMA 4100]|uniref:ABC transporter permease n=1 Tax=Leucobacter sp. UCMA 4100 TaxID=2810534 RepID=UPI0022EA870F|nr:ABC transporter permease [Leucobacter sp. UCMA 4100]MDA3146999.1 ABC transporter permease [Leucobacter sp. UCMA 4100]